MTSVATYMAAVAVILVFLARQAGSADITQHLYQENTGGTETTHTLITRRDGGDVVMRWIAPDRTYYNLCDLSGDTREWRLKDADTDIIAHRSASTLRLEGVFRGEAVKRSVEIDADPWYQPLSYALGQFSQSGRGSIRFWTIRPDTLEPVKLQAERQDSEPVLTAAGLYVAHKVRISATGLLSRFWKANYWFRMKDGLFVRYEGSNGLPATEKPIILLEG
jgi:hypothetical protein